MTITTHDLPPINTPDLPACEWELIDPTTAALYLRRNKKNRRVRHGHVMALARDLAGDAWALTGETIKFDLDGNLIDGQHRLSAVVEVKRPAWFLVVRGLSSSVMGVLDQNARRTAADALALNDFSNTNVLAAVARIGISWDEGLIRFASQGQPRKVTHSEVLSWVSSHPAAIGSAAQAETWRKTIPARPAVIGFARYLTSGVNGAESLCFFDDLAEYRTAGSGDPRHALLRRLNKARDNRERLTTVSELYLFLRVWNAVRTGEALHRLQTGTNATVMPEPV